MWQVLLIVSIVVLFIIILSSILFKQDKRRSEAKTVVLFHRPSCPYCREFYPEWKKYMANTSSKTVDVNIETPEGQALSNKFGVSSVPTILVGDTDIYEYKGPRYAENMTKIIDWV